MHVQSLLQILPAKKHGQLPFLHPVLLHKQPSLVLLSLRRLSISSGSSCYTIIGAATSVERFLLFGAFGTWFSSFVSCLFSIFASCQFLLFRFRISVLALFWCFLLVFLFLIFACYHCVLFAFLGNVIIMLSKASKVICCVD